MTAISDPLVRAALSAWDQADLDDPSREDTVRAVLAAVLPRLDRWTAAGRPNRDVWEDA